MNPSQLKYFVCTLLFVFTSLLHASNIRIAIIPVSQDIRCLADILITEFSHKKDYIVLSRIELDSIVREYTLNSFQHKNSYKKFIKSADALVIINRITIRDTKYNVLKLVWTHSGTLEYSQCTI